MKFSDQRPFSSLANFSVLDHFIVSQKQTKKNPNKKQQQKKPTTKPQMPRGRFNMTLFLNCISKKVYDMENLKLISDFIKLRVLYRFIGNTELASSSK